MDNYKEYLELHLVGLLDLFDIIKTIIEDKIPIDIKLSNKHDNSHNDRKIYRLSTHYDIFLIVYLTKDGPTFMIAFAINDIFVEEIDIIPLNLYSNIEQELLMTRLKYGHFASYKKYIDDYNNGSDFVKDFGINLSLLNSKVLDNALDFVRSYMS